MIFLLHSAKGLLKNRDSVYMYERFLRYIVIL